MDMFVLKTTNDNLNIKVELEEYENKSKDIIEKY